MPDSTPQATATGQMGTTPTRRSIDGGLAVAAVMVVAAAVRGAWELASIAASSSRLPLWDEAKYGASGLRLADALAELDPVRFLVELNGLSVWPPTWPLAQVVPFWIAGPGVEVPRVVASWVWLAIAITTWWVGRGLVDRHGDAVGMLAAAAFMASPASWTFATLGMLELPGVFLLALALGSYGRAVERRSLAWWRAVWIATTCLFFCKYNYGLLWLVPLALAEALRRAGSWRQLVASGDRLRRDIPWRSPWVVLIALAVGILALVRVTGGVDTEVAGIRLRMTSAGNPLYGLYLLLLGRLAWSARRHADAWRRRLDSLDPVWRSGLVWTAAPIAAWMLLPPHVKDFVGFVENRSSDLGWLDALRFYPDVLVHHFAPTPAVGWSLVGLATLGCVVAIRRGSPRQILALAIVVAAVALVGHPYKLPRFAVSLAWLIGMAAALTIVDLTARIGARHGPRVAFGLGLLGLGACLVGGVDSDAVVRDHARWTAPAEVAAVLDHLMEIERRRDGLLVLGTWNFLSPWLIEQWAEGRAPEVAVPRPTTGFELGRRRAWAIRRALDDPQSAIGTVAWVDYVGPESDPLVAVFGAETAWRDELIPYFEAAPWRVRERTSFDGAGYRVVVIERD